MTQAVNGVSAAQQQDVSLPLAPDGRRLLRRDYVILCAFCLLLFGYEMFSGRPLSLHEARLPETSREMLHTHHWLFPHSGERPWLERPPIPHWIEIGTSFVLGQKCDSVWVVRLPSVLMGLAIVLMTAWTASVWFGRQIGMLSGLVLATMYEFYAYSVLAEDDIFLGAFVALAITLFVGIEFIWHNRDTSDVSDGKSSGAGWLISFVGNRPWQVWAFFIVLGLMNMVKSPLLGPAVVLPQIFAFLALGVFFSGSGLWRVRRYVWLWGWIVFAILLFAWTKAAAHYFPDVVENWKYDYEETTQYDEAFWYYGSVLLAFCMPWILASIPGFIVTCRKALRMPFSGEQFLWLWAILPVLALSVPHRKHHHYLVPSIAPWAILSAIGLRIIWRDLTDPRKKPMNFWVPGIIAAVAIGFSAALTAPVASHFFHKQLPISLTSLVVLAIVIVACVQAFFWAGYQRLGTLAAAACFIGIGFSYCWGQSTLPDLTADDTAFLHRVDREAPSDKPLYVNADLGGEMDFFRNQFYLRPTAILLHNLTYLRDQEITAVDVWVITRKKDEPKLQQLGKVDVEDISGHTRRERSPEDRFTLFHLRFFSNLKRYPKPPYITTLQAMDRAKGPYLGPPL